MVVDGVLRRLILRNSVGLTAHCNTNAAWMHAAVTDLLRIDNGTGDEDCTIIIISNTTEVVGVYDTGYWSPNNVHLRVSWAMWSTLGSPILTGSVFPHNTAIVKCLGIALSLP